MQTTADLLTAAATHTNHLHRHLLSKQSAAYSVKIVILLLLLLLLPVGVPRQCPHGEDIAVRSVRDAAGPVEHASNTFLCPVTARQLRQQRNSDSERKLITATGAPASA